MNHTYIKTFRCIKSFEVDRADDYGVILESEPPYTIKKGTVWEVMFLGSEPHWISYEIGGNGRLTDFSKEDWGDEEYFEEITSKEVPN